MRFSPKKVAAGEDLDIYSLHGASELSNLCHRLIAVKRLTDDEEGYSIECQIIKDRPTQAAGKSCKLMYDTATRRIYSTNEELYQQFSWENHLILIIQMQLKRICYVIEKMFSQLFQKLYRILLSATSIKF